MAPALGSAAHWPPEMKCDGGTWGEGGLRTWRLLAPA